MVISSVRYISGENILTRSGLEIPCTLLFKHKPKEVQKMKLSKGNFKEGVVKGNFKEVVNHR